MRRSGTFGISVREVEQMQQMVDDYKVWIASRSKILLDRLAQMGAAEVSLRFARAVYTGVKDAKITVAKISNGYVIKANGESVLFIEFGSGVRYGYGHPEAGEHGMGPGTYPSDKGHWNDPNGWWIPRDKGGGHTYGNPPGMPMYSTVRDLEKKLPALIKEVFR